MERLKFAEKQVESDMDYGQKIAKKWDSIQNSPEFDLIRISTDISEAIDHAYQNGAFILPKTPEEIKSAIEQDRLVAIMGRDSDMMLSFVAAAVYSHLGKDVNGSEVIEVGALISNPKVTTNKGREGKKYVVALNTGVVNDYKKTFGALVLEAVLAKVKLNCKDVESLKIIATARSEKSEKALRTSGFIPIDWDIATRKVSCDPNCRNVKDYQNCHLADKEFTSTGDSGCHLLVYPS